MRYGKEIGIEVIKGEELTVGSTNVSSSSIRRMLKEGNIEDATRCLGHEYQLTGTVVAGEHIGRTIGFPTANIRPNDSSKLIPANGVYAVDVWSESEEDYSKSEVITRRRAMLNIGTRPTFDHHRGAYSRFQGQSLRQDAHHLLHLKNQGRKTFRLSRGTRGAVEQGLGYYNKTQRHGGTEVYKIRFRKTQSCLCVE